MSPLPWPYVTLYAGSIKRKSPSSPRMLTVTHT